MGRQTYQQRYRDAQVAGQVTIIRRIRINEAWIPFRDYRERRKTRAASTRDDARPR